MAYIFNNAYDYVNNYFIILMEYMLNSYGMMTTLWYNYRYSTYDVNYPIYL
jgi:hypothetical protein